jgi:transcriptional regulator with XRE-family HTH domain
MENNVKQYRLEMKLSQSRLAELVGTSQQQIQRLETGRAPIRLDIGEKICKALQQPMDVLFLGSEKAERKADRERKSSDFLELEAWEDMRESGLEPDPRVWTIEIGLQGHDTPLFYNISPREKARIYKDIQSEEDAHPEVCRFVVLESTERMLAINLRELNYCHFQFERTDVADLIDTSLEASEADTHFDPIRALIYQVGGGKPLSLYLEVDDQFEDDGEMGQCRGFFYELEHDCSNSRRLCLEDNDGETIFIRVGNLALLDVPLFVLEGEEDDDHE